MTTPVTKAAADAAWTAAVEELAQRCRLSKSAAALALSYTDEGRKLYQQCNSAAAREAREIYKARYGG